MSEPNEPPGSAPADKPVFTPPCSDVGRWVEDVEMQAVALVVQGTQASLNVLKCSVLLPLLGFEPVSFHVLTHSAVPCPVFVIKFCSGRIKFFFS